MGLYTADGRRRILPPLLFGLGVLAQLLREGRRYDVVHCASFPYFSLLAAGIARPLGGYGLIVDWHEVWSEAYWREYLGRVGGAVGTLVQRLCARVRQHAFCFSSCTQRACERKGCVASSPCSRVSTQAVRKPSPARAVDPVVVFAGRLIPEKRAPLAVAAFAAAAARIDGLRGELYGDGPEREAVREAIVAHGLGERLHASGFVAAERIDQALSGAMCMLSTSRREGYGLVVVEAAARATPSVVVAGEDNAAVELITEGVNGFVAADADPQTVADAIVRVHDEGLALRQSTARWFAENADRLSLERSLERVLESYAARARA